MTAFATNKAEAFLNGINGINSRDEPLPVLETDEATDTTPLNLGALGLVEMILKRPALLDRLIRDPQLQPILLPQLLAISLIGFVFFGVAMSLVLTCSHAWPELTAISDRLRNQAVQLVSFKTTTDIGTHWLNGAALKLTAAYAFGLIAATGVCLPSLYFYGLLAGVVDDVPQPVGS